MDAAALASDPHFKQGCVVCHRGDPAGTDKASAHKGLEKRPSDDLKTCGACHARTAERYGKALHYTTEGQRTGVRPRFSAAEAKRFDEKVFEASCRSCHASCGDCHVKSPAVGGVSIGLIQGHKFVKKDEGKTCAFCHGGRVYPEYVGDYGGAPDAHYAKGMMCMDCHKRVEMHGDGTRQTAKNAVKDRPKCRNCHTLSKEAKLTARVAHARHEGKASCYACHADGAYRQCSDCHLGGGATSKPGMILGRSPRDGKTLSTLRLIPTVRGTFAKAGIRQENFDAVPNYWDTPAHTIRKRTDRTRSCDVCHVDGKHYLKKEQLIPGGAKANEGLIAVPKPLDP